MKRQVQALRFPESHLLAARGRECQSSSPAPRRAPGCGCPGRRPGSDGDVGPRVRTPGQAPHGLGDVRRPAGEVLQHPPSSLLCLFQPPAPKQAMEKAGWTQVLLPSLVWASLCPHEDLPHRGGPGQPHRTCCKSSSPPRPPGPICRHSRGDCAAWDGAEGLPAPRGAEGIPEIAALQPCA